MEGNNIHSKKFAFTDMLTTKFPKDHKIEFLLKDKAILSKNSKLKYMIETNVFYPMPTVIKTEENLDISIVAGTTYIHKKNTETTFIQQTYQIYTKPAKIIFVEESELVFIKENDGEISKDSDDLTEFVDSNEAIAYLKGEQWAVSEDTQIKCVIPTDIKFYQGARLMLNTDEEETLVEAGTIQQFEPGTRIKFLIESILIWFLFLHFKL